MSTANKETSPSYPSKSPSRSTPPVSCPLLQIPPSSFELLLPEAQVQRRPEHSWVPQASLGKKQELKALLGANKRLQKKISKAIEFFCAMSQQYGMVSTPPVTESLDAYSAESVNSRQMIDGIQERESVPGPFVLKIPLSKELHKQIELIPPRPQTKTELCINLDRLQCEILSSLPSWTIDSLNHVPMIKLLEDYKRTIRRLVRLWAKEEDPYEKLFEQLKELRKVAESEQFKVPLYFSGIAGKRKRGSPEVEINGHANPQNLAKAYIKALGGKDSPWLQTFSYFPEIPETVIDPFTAIHMPTSRSLLIGNTKPLPLYAINRLSAIAKMLQYCKESRIDLEQFQKGRIRQKISALQLQRKCLREDPRLYPKHSTFYQGNGHSNGTTDHDSLSYPPTQDELDYLLGLDVSQIDWIITELKDCLYSGNSPATDTEMGFSSKEAELFSLTIKQQARHRDILRKIFAEKSRVRYHSDHLVKRYLKLLPVMQRKHDKRFAEEQKILRKSLNEPAEPKRTILGKITGSGKLENIRENSVPENSVEPNVGGGDDSMYNNNSRSHSCIMSAKSVRSSARVGYSDSDSGLYSYEPEVEENSNKEEIGSVAPFC